jgi:hypothetical protein
MNQNDVSAVLALCVIDGPNPAAFMDKQVGLLIQHQSFQTSNALAGFLGCFLRRNKNVAFDKLGNNTRTIHQDNGFFA